MGAKGVGRYDGVKAAMMPGEGLAKPQEPGRRRATRRGVATASRFAVGAVPDPWGDGRQKLQTTINREVDVLEQERSAGRISEAAYLTGRVVQAAFERGVRVGTSNWAGASRVDVASAHEMAIGFSVESASLVNSIVFRMEQAVGKVGARFLRAVIAEGLSFKGVAAARGQTNERAATYAGERFRCLLEDLAEEWAAKGKSAAQIVTSFGTSEIVSRENRNKAPSPPVLAGKSEVTEHLGRATLKAAGGTDRTSRAMVVRTGLRRR